MIKINIYTRTGDTGYTGTLAGDRVSKASKQITLQGEIDELNCHIGYFNSLLSECTFKEKEELLSISKHLQDGIFSVGSEVSSKFSINKIKKDHIEYLESEIDKILSELPDLKLFQRISGTKEATYCQLIRAITRRCERNFVAYIEELEIDFPISYEFINRLSDFFYVLGRYINHCSGITEDKMKMW
ncbi:MAG: cob(I)yrinic acid a,c-diamide adenosyltransferase [Clostridiaceae bacterium]